MKKIVIVLLCVFSILIGYIAYDKSDGVSGLRENIGLEIKARSNPKLRTILNNKDQFSKEVLIAAHALLNEKNEMIKCIRQLKKSDSLLKYRLVKWPVLRNFVNDKDFKSVLGLE